MGSDIGLNKADASSMDSPACDCGEHMWLVRLDTHLSDDGTLTERTYECASCGAKRVVRSGSDKIVPATSVDSGR